MTKFAGPNLFVKRGERLGKRTARKCPSMALPKYSEMILSAVKASSRLEGSTCQGIIKYIQKKYAVPKSKVAQKVTKNLRTMVQNQQLIFSSGNNDAVRFRIHQKSLSKPVVYEQEKSLVPMPSGLPKIRCCATVSTRSRACMLKGQERRASKQKFSNMKAKKDNSKTPSSLLRSLIGEKADKYLKPRPSAKALCCECGYDNGSTTKKRQNKENSARCVLNNLFRCKTRKKKKSQNVCCCCPMVAKKKKRKRRNREQCCCLMTCCPQPKKKRKKKKSTNCCCCVRMIECPKPAKKKRKKRTCCFEKLMKCTKPAKKRRRKRRKTKCILESLRCSSRSVKDSCEKKRSKKPKSRKCYHSASKVWRRSPFTEGD